MVGENWLTIETLGRGSRSRGQKAIKLRCSHGMLGVWSIRRLSRRLLNVLVNIKQLKADLAGRGELSKASV
jgi:hypothetical protein